MQTYISIHERLNGKVGGVERTSFTSASEAEGWKENITMWRIGIFVWCIGESTSEVNGWMEGSMIVRKVQGCRRT